MSSPDFPTLNLDVSTRRAERAVAGFTFISSVAALGLLQLPTVTVAAVMVCAAIGIGLGFGAIGWLGGPRRLTRISWQPDGIWLLNDAAGRTMEARLSGASRVTPAVLWLRWSGRAGTPLLLTRGDVASEEFRRLVVRLRLSDRLSPKDVHAEP
jgi:hypothetical protein